MKKMLSTTISDVPSFLNWVQKVQNNGISLQSKGENISIPMNNPYFRGQADINYELLPSVYRNRDYYLNESELLNEASRILWSEIIDMKSSLEKIVFFQHYGLKTRLLDITFNPLIALYFACNEKRNEKNGVVYIGNSKSNSDWVVGELTAKFLFQYRIQQAGSEKDLKKFLKGEKCKMEIAAFTKPLYINPPLNNPRIIAQHGAFIMLPLFKENNQNYELFKENLSNTDCFIDKYACIPADKKESILRELARLGYDEGSIYGDIEHKLKAIVDCYEINDITKNILK